MFQLLGFIMPFFAQNKSLKMTSEKSSLNRLGLGNLLDPNFIIILFFRCPIQSN